jgi:hypothetical protein
MLANKIDKMANKHNGDLFFEKIWDGGLEEQDLKFLRLLPNRFQILRPHFLDFLKPLSGLVGAVGIEPTTR